MATLSTTEILSDTLDAFKLQFPMITNFTTDFSSQAATKGDTIKAHIATLPAASTYDATTGYANGATAAESLLEDVDVTLDQHAHVPIKLDYLSMISNQKAIYQQEVDNKAYVLGKQMVDFALGKVLAANFTNAVNAGATAAASDRDTLLAIRKEMNLNGASPKGRFGIVNGDVYEALDGDPRIASADYHGQQLEGNSLGELTNVAGFEKIYEYPTLSANAELLQGIFLDPTGIVIGSRLPNHNQDYASALGIPRAGKFDVVQDPESGLAMLGISWEQPGTFDQFLTVTLIYGAAAGAQGGSAGDITDNAGVRLTATA